MAKIEPPKIENRKFSELLKILKAMAPHYTPEWAASDEKDAGVALLKIFSHLSEHIINRLNQAPHKNFVAFLDMLGIKLLPAQSARVPLTFKLAKGTEKELLIPARTQAATDKTEEHEELPFETEKNLWAIVNKLQEFISVDPFQDAIYVHTTNVVSEDGNMRDKQGAFTVFSGIDQQEHSLYLGHTDLFNIESAGEVTIEIALALGTEIGNSSQNLIWEYWGEDKENQKDNWIAFQVQEDRTDGFKQSGKITLLKLKEGKIKEEKLDEIFKKTSRVAIKDETIKEIKTRWVRCRLETPLTLNKSIKLPILDTISIRTETKVPIKADKAFYQDVPLNMGEAAVIRNMLPLDIQLSLIFPGDTSATLEETPTNALKDGDLLEFDNGTDPPERRVISIQSPIMSVSITWEGGLLYEYDPATTIVRILTAIRPGEQTPTVRLESVEGLAQDDRITLIGAESITAAINSVDLTKKTITLGLDQSQVNTAYIEGDIVLKGEGIPNFPFGKQPRFYDTFSLASQEAFSKKGAVIEISLNLKHQNTSSGLIPPPNPQLSWEYWDGKGWQALADVQDSTNRLLNTGENSIRFHVPANIAETEINGQKNYWIRARIVGGDYGKDEYILEESINQTTKKKETKTRVERKFKLPIIRDLVINYYYEENEKLQHCLTYNNLNFQDKTSGSKTENQFFRPFIHMEDTHRNLYLGFDSPLRSGPIRIFFNAKELSYTEEKKPKIDWNYRDMGGWTLLDYLDETEGLIARGHLELIGPSNFTSYAMFGQSLYWIQGSLVKGNYESLPELQGIYPNTTWALQAETIRDEILGSSDGEPDQTFSFLKFPILPEEEIRVRETLSEEEKQTLMTSLGEAAIFEVKDETGKVTEIWVLWSEVPDFFDSSATSRHYTLDRATGTIQFGDGKNGMIPSAGDDNIKAFFYQAGGGAQGNVAAGEIKTMKSAVAGVDKVSNPVAADGGADTARLDEMLEIGPAMISHRNRAVTVEDFEWLAKQASRKVVKVRCLPNTNNRKQIEIGRVTVIIVPDSPEAQPFPSLELRRKVQRYLEAHCANTLTSAKHVYVVGPSYQEIGVSVDLFVTSIDVASETEREARKKLRAFFHPLTGGPEKKGWNFGRDVAVSDIYVLLEDIEGIDHVKNLKFRFNGTTTEDIVEVERDFLAANGKHTLNLQLINGG